MKRVRIIAILSGLAIWFSSQSAIRCFSADDPKVDTVSQPELAEELRVRVESDQACRTEWIEYGTKQKVFGVALDSLDPPVAEKFSTLTNKMEKCDEQNRVWLKEVVQKHGWPGKSLVGTDGAKNAWLLVQHADKDRVFQQECLKKMTELPKDEVSQKDIAYLTDRILSGTGKKQRYGTQALLKDGKMIFYPIEDEDQVDERRKAMGLGPLGEYLRVLEQAYGISKSPDAEEGGSP